MLKTDHTDLLSVYFILTLLVRYRPDYPPYGHLNHPNMYNASGVYKCSFNTYSLNTQIWLFFR